ncbi:MULTISPECIES: hypothetical protein [Lysinibacillus]|uniref:hypothetical protein n=1 Tax=Lysinibacillus TaxID=400634 RepID=UPI001C303F70|nr:MULTISPECIES: hypothetical protein [Lysinibacillus]MCK1989481.1 hypothetical protein [Lysinibacillus fusiformis]
MEQEFKIGKHLLGKLNSFEVEVAKEFYRKLDLEEKDIDLKNVYLPIINKVVEELIDPARNKDLMKQTVHCLQVEYEQYYNNPYWISDIKINVRFIFL